MTTMTEGKQPCARCGASILQETARKTGGLCMPCKEGRREAMDEAARRNAEDRARRAAAEQARAPLMARLAAGEALRFADFFHLDDPPYEIFRAASRTVYADDSRQAQLGRLSPECRLAYVLWCLGGDVDNEGFGSWIAGASPALLAEALAGLEIIGAERMETLLQRALRWFPEALFTEDRQLRRQRYEALAKREDFEREMEQLDEAMYAHAADYFELIGDYIRAHPDAPITGQAGSEPRRNAL